MTVSLLPFLLEILSLGMLLFLLGKGLHELHFGTRGWSRRLFLTLFVLFSAANWQFFFKVGNGFDGQSAFVLITFSAAIWAAFRLFEKEKNEAGLIVFSAAWLAVFAFFFDPNCQAAFDFKKLKTATFWLFSPQFASVLLVFGYFLKKTDRATLAKKALLAGCVFGSVGSVFLNEKGATAAILTAYFSALFVVFPVWDRALMLGLSWLKKWQVWTVVGLLFLMQLAGFFF